MAMTKVKNLQLWCKKMTEGYRDVDVKDMTSSWKNGLAFCALIHRFRPDLIDYDSLSKENVLENNQLAFDVAEKELNIPAFLDAPDMVAIRVPDRLSIVTYVSQYYNNLHDKPQLGGPEVKKAVATKRHQETEPSGPVAKRLTPSQEITPTKERQVSMGDKCHICGDKVYLMERHVDKNKLYHRHCFRHSDLSPTSKVFNKSELKKISDKVKSETKAEKDSGSQPDFWKRRNEARKVVKMDTDESVSSKEAVNNAKNEALSSDKTSPSKLIKHDKKHSKEISQQKDRPTVLDFTSKADVKKSTEPKPSPRKHKPDHVEPMDTSNNDSVLTKPVPTPRYIKPEKDNPVNGFLARKKIPDILKSPSESSPPPLPSQPPPSHLQKSDVLSPASDSHKFTYPSGHVDKSKSSVIPDKTSPQLNPKSQPSHPIPSNRTPSPKNKFSPREPKSTSHFFVPSSTSEFSKNDVNSKDQKFSPKTKKKHFEDVSSTKSHKTENLSPPTSRHAGKPVETKNTDDKNVLGGLLANLANIRKQKNSASSPTEDIVNHRPTTAIVDNQPTDTRSHVKSAIVTKLPCDSEQNKNRDSDLKVKHQTDSDVPEWKRQLEKRRNELSKSVDISSARKDNSSVIKDIDINDTRKEIKTERNQNPPRPKSADLLSDKNRLDKKPQWQVEAEKRIEARKGGYVDPEKSRVSTDGIKDENEAPFKPSRVDIEIKDDKKVPKRVLPAVPSHTDKDDHTTQEKKRISVNVKFDFSSELKKPEKTKPARPQPSWIQNTSKTPEKPPRPAPPLKDADVKRISPAEIQKQLTEIDSRLRELEIRGRQLEVSIRKAQEEEDEKMMVEWFDLVNNKNELVRKEADLIYVSREQELENEQDQIDKKLRRLMAKEDKTEEEKAEEELLLQKKLDVVNQRSVIVDTIDEDRIRYEEEDKDIAIAIQALSQDSAHVTIQSTEVAQFKKKKKKKGKIL